MITASIAIYKKGIKLRIKLFFIKDLQVVREICVLKKQPFKAKFEKEIDYKIKDLSRRFKKYNPQINELFTQVFRFLPQKILKIEVVVFPAEVEMGAVNCEEKRILYGYKKLTKNFDFSIITHETSHILFYPLRNKGELNMLAEEVFCYFVENELLRRISNMPFFSVWGKKHIDNYHKQCFQVAENNYLLWQAYLKKEINFSNFAKIISVQFQKNTLQEYKLTDFI